MRFTIFHHNNELTSERYCIPFGVSDERAPSALYLPLTLKSANSFFIILMECLLIGFYTKMDLYSQPTWPNMGNFYVKFIHWATRGRLNNHCNNKDVIGIKWRRTATGFLHTSGIQAWSTIFNYVSCIWLYSSINGNVKRTGYNNLGPSYGPFSKVCKQFAWFSCLFSWSLYSWRVLAWYLRNRVNPYTSF